MSVFHIDDGEQAVRELVADLLEKLSKQLKEGQDPNIYLTYFGATLQVRLVGFEGMTL